MLRAEGVLGKIFECDLTLARQEPWNAARCSRSRIPDGGGGGDIECRGKLEIS